VNIIEPLASSSSEIITRLLKEWDERLFDKNIATPLFAGIVASTGNFQNTRTKPSTLYEAAFLLSHEADRESIIKNFFKTKPFELLKLCGIAMSKLNFNEDLALSWLILSKDDFAQSGAGENDVPQIILELKNSFAYSSLIIVFWESENSFRAVLHTLHEDKIRLLATETKGERQGNNIFFNLFSREISACEKFIEEISRKLGNFRVQ